jgi:hypothetical protein
MSASDQNAQITLVEKRPVVTPRLGERGGRRIAYICIAQ